MSTAQANSKPKTAPVIVLKNQDTGSINFLRLLPAVLASILFHGALIGLVLLLVLGMATEGPALEPNKDDPVVNADPPEEKPSSDPFMTTDIDPAAQEF